MHTVGPITLLLVALVPVALGVRVWRCERRYRRYLREGYDERLALRLTLGLR